MPVKSDSALLYSCLMLLLRSLQLLVVHAMPTRSHAGCALHSMPQSIFACQVAFIFSSQLWPACIFACRAIPHLQQSALACLHLCTSSHSASTAVSPGLPAILHVKPMLHLQQSALACLVQNDLHSPQATIKEALWFSARLRLGPEVSKQGHVGLHLPGGCCAASGTSNVPQTTLHIASLLHRCLPATLRPC